MLAVPSAHHRLPDAVHRTRSWHQVHASEAGCCVSVAEGAPRKTTKKANKGKGKGPGSDDPTLTVMEPFNPAD